MSNKFTIEVNITNVDSLLKEDPSVQRDSEIVANQNLEWQGRVKLLKPKSNPTSTTCRTCRCTNVDDNKAYLSFFLYCRTPTPVSGNWKCKADYKMTLVRKREDGNPWDGWGREKFIGFDDFLKGDYVKDNQALFRIEVEVGVPSGLHVVEKGQLSKTLVETRMSGILSLLNSGKGSSVTLITKDGELVKAHRDILMAWSPVFATILEIVGEAARPYPEIHLPDLTSSCLQTMLEHIYGAPLSKLERIPLSLVQELIPAAHMYELDELKEYCGHLLVERWIPSNLWEMYNMTKKYNLDGPKKELEEIMKDHVGEILDQAASEMRLQDKDEDD